ncbi:hypothetical protein BMR1_02g02711 [Babesia microti strain RI]|uniref:Uncharacterized protein n=1 Tax=Babesia microti (strain RI) TaxID=1133968 RepID=A0A1R4AAL0_BABMR|nr:hypothetical protein BMR1_02g02711 [Babesia microti strain RI]SJK86033.1 hypothetical protein BMR1_02g02711 [Babesia microti strain RI]|eukprot:XP_021338230.1 hypothetical protein BMR1_02g02711 [Babesia microti strain RI]
MFTNFIPLFLPFFVSMILQRINTSRDGTNNN